VRSLDTALIRRYLLGVTDERESAVIEQRFLDDPNALDEVAVLEDDLIEDYLESSLEPGALVQFERHYLSAPRHRARVETVRRLIAASRDATGESRAVVTSVPRAAPRWSGWLSLATAAVLAFAVAGAIWTYRASTNKAPAATAPLPSTSVAGQPPGPPGPAAPRVFAFSVSPVGVRSGDNRPSLVVPDGVDVVALDLQRGDGDDHLSAPRVVVRTVSGRDAWSGPAAVDNLPTGIVARLEIPAPRLPADDYTITLIDSDRQGREREGRTYFLRVRTR
jgi:hypothetical protein